MWLCTWRKIPLQEWLVGLTHFLASSSLSLILALKHNAVPYWLDLHLMHVPLPLSFSAQGLALLGDKMAKENGPSAKWAIKFLSEEDTLLPFLG